MGRAPAARPAAWRGEGVGARSTVRPSGARRAPRDGRRSVAGPRDAERRRAARAPAGASARCGHPAKKGASPAAMAGVGAGVLVLRSAPS